MGADRVSPSEMLKYLVLLFVVATVFGEPEPSAVADAAPKADADPWYYYGGYPYGLYGHGGYLWGRKRRSAEPDAEPAADAEADPYLLYGGYYGLGHYGLGYGHYGYGYPYGYAYWG